MAFRKKGLHLFYSSQESIWLIKEMFGVLWSECPGKGKQVTLFNSSIKGMEDSALELELELFPWF